jgi:hypothetical protein
MRKSINASIRKIPLYQNRGFDEQNKTPTRLAPNWREQGGMLFEEPISSALKVERFVKGF